MKIFRHGRRAALIDDPDKALAQGVAGGQFAQRCSSPADSPAFIAALESNGRMPVGGMRSGLSVAQIAIALTGLGLCVIGGLIAVAAGRGMVAGIVIAVVGALLLVLAVMSSRKRIKGVENLGAAWRSGWLRFTPARVGGMWIDSVTHHGSPSDDHNSDVRYEYRALVEVWPTNGEPRFVFVTSPFSVIGERDGKSRGMEISPEPLDQFEPEFSNGWTVARWVAGNPASATITTELSERQIVAALQTQQLG